MGKFPADIQDFGNVFVKAQAQRYAADYDPSYNAVKAAVLTELAAAESVVRKLGSAPLKDRRALATWVTLSIGDGPRAVAGTLGSPARPW